MAFVQILICANINTYKHAKARSGAARPSKRSSRLHVTHDAEQCTHRYKADLVRKFSAELTHFDTGKYTVIKYVFIQIIESPRVRYTFGLVWRSHDTESVWLGRAPAKARAWLPLHAPCAPGEVFESLSAADEAHEYMLTNANNGKIVVVVGKASAPHTKQERGFHANYYQGAITG